MNFWIHHNLSDFIYAPPLKLKLSKNDIYWTCSPWIQLTTLFPDWNLNCIHFLMWRLHLQHAWRVKPDVDSFISILDQRNFPSIFKTPVTKKQLSNTIKINNGNKIIVISASTIVKNKAVSDTRESMRNKLSRQWKDLKITAAWFDYQCGVNNTTFDCYNFFFLFRLSSLRSNWNRCFTFSLSLPLFLSLHLVKWLNIFNWKGVPRLLMNGEWQSRRYFCVIISVNSISIDL